MVAHPPTLTDQLNQQGQCCCLERLSQHSDKRRGLCTSLTLPGVPRVLGTGLATLAELSEGQDEPPSSQWPMTLLPPSGNWEGSGEEGWELLEASMETGCLGPFYGKWPCPLQGECPVHYTEC